MTVVPRRTARPRALLALCVGAALLVALLSPLTGSAMASPPREIHPTSIPGEMLSFSSPALEPGGSGTLTATLANPASDPLNGTLTSATLELQVYRFAYEGNSQNLTQGDSWAVSLALPGGASSFSVNGSFPSVAPGATAALSVGIEVPSSATAGSYFVRDRLNFSANGISYVTASVGFFPPALLDKALLQCGSEGNCTPYVNLGLLNVSGISPETSISVSSPWTPIILGAILAAAAGLAIAAGYVAFRRRGRPVVERGSRSGARSSPRRTKAAKALGKSRTSDGD
jgi:hypothetical protein